jgi:hypothetical protein
MKFTKKSVQAEFTSNLNRIQSQQKLVDQPSASNASSNKTKTTGPSHIPAQPESVAEQVSAWTLLPSPLFISDPSSSLPSKLLHVPAAPTTLASSSRRLAAPPCHCSSKSGVPAQIPASRAAGRRIEGEEGGDGRSTYGCQE